MHYVTASENETQEVAQAIVRTLLLKKKTGPILVGLVGDLGAGKTTFMKGVAHFFDIREPIVSPTFVIQKVYTIPQNNREELGHQFERLIHMDMYRLESEDMLRTIDWDEYKNKKEHILFVEWPNQIWKVNPKDMFVITLEHNNDGTRTITYHE